MLTLGPLTDLGPGLLSRFEVAIENAEREALGRPKDHLSLRIMAYHLRTLRILHPDVWASVCLHDISPEDTVRRATQHIMIAMIAPEEGSGRRRPEPETRS